MVYPSVSLRAMGIVLGVFLILLHALALWRREDAQSWLRALPRSVNLGVTLLALDTLWAFLLITFMDLGEFSHLRRVLQIIIPIAAVLTYRFVDEFLAARALGILLLLAAEPVLEAAFLRPEASRLLVVVLAYAWVVLGMFYVGMPYLLRNQIEFLTRSDARWRTAAGAGSVYGILVLACAVIFW